MSQLTQTPPETSFNAKEVLTQSLNLWWLRPENGLAIASYALKGVSLLPREGERAVEYACGDGVNTFFKCGGRFDPSFDLFQAGVREEKAQDVVDQHIDVFDAFDEDYHPVITKQPTKTYAAGTDHKAMLLKKAERLAFYDNLICGDLQQPIRDLQEPYDLAYCNSLYWVPAPEVAVEHIHRQLRQGGRAIFDVFTSNKRLLDFRTLVPTAGYKWHGLMNRGRMENNPGLRSEKEWETLFKKAGFIVDERREILPAGVAHLWNIGLRPIFPVLRRMAEGLTPENRLQIKAEWVEIWQELLHPVLEEPEGFCKDRNSYRIQYVLSRA